jgi:hypothetical protein
VREHLGLAATVFLFAFVNLRMLAIGGFDVVTAAAVLEAATPTQVAVGLLLQATGPLALFGVIWAVGRWLLLRNELAPSRIRDLRFAIVILGLISVATTPVIFFTSPLVAWISRLGLRHVERRRRLAHQRSRLVGVGQGALTRAEAQEDLRRERRDRAARAEQARREYQALLRALVVVPIVFFLIAEPWVPPEVVEYGQERVVAYVLEDDGAWNDLLLRSPRQVIRVRAHEVTDRQLCAASHRPFPIWIMRPLPYWLGSSGDIPTCPIQ